MDHLRALAELQERFLDTTRRADPATPIPWLGRWQAKQLVVHLARIHHWAAGQARRTQETPLGRVPPPAARLVLEPSGADASWSLTGAAADAPSVALAGPARSLALLAWGRVGLDPAALDAAGIEVRGDRALVERVVGAGLTP